MHCNKLGFEKELEPEAPCLRKNCYDHQPYIAPWTVVVVVVVVVVVILKDDQTIMKHMSFLMISAGSGLVWNGLLKAFGGLLGPILNVFFDFPNNYFLTVPPGAFP